jgi:hypothetical protein
MEYWLRSRPLAADDVIVAGAQERNRRLLERLGKDEVRVLLDQNDRLTDTAARMLADEKDCTKIPHGRANASASEAGAQHLLTSAGAPRTWNDVKLACLAPSVALR